MPGCPLLTWVISDRYDNVFSGVSLHRTEKEPLNGLWAVVVLICLERNKNINISQPVLPEET